MKPQYRFHKWHLATDPITFELKKVRSYITGEMVTEKIYGREHSYLKQTLIGKYVGVEK